MSAPAAPVYVLDEVELRAGVDADVFLSALDARYRPGAERRGMTLRHRWVTPPETPPGVGATVLLVWSVSGVAGFWTMRSQNAAPEVADWWRECEALCVRRTRRFAVDADARAAFAAAGREHA